MWILWTPLWINKPTHLLVWSRSARPGHQDPSCLQKEPWRWCHTEFYREDLSGRDQRGGMEQINKQKKDTSIFSSALLQSCPEAEHHIRVEGDITLPSGLHCEAWVTVLESSTLCFLANAFSRQTPSGELITRKWKWPANAHQSGIITICDSLSAPPCLRTVPRRTAKINFCTFQRQQTK